MKYQGLRDWLKKVEQMDEMAHISGVDWNLEVGAIYQLASNRDNGPAVLLDDIKDYPSGHRILLNALGSIKRMALTLDFPTDLTPTQFIRAWKDYQKKIQYNIPPEVVKSGPVFENVVEENQINLYQLPAPWWHEHDGGRYLGVGSVTITRDPDQGWVNLATYRVMIHDEKTLSCYIAPGKHGRMHRDKALSAGQSFKIAISFGHDPLVFFAGGMDCPPGVSEYDFMGAIKKHPYEVVEGGFSGLPIPADSEIAIEGEILPGEQMKEGPFGEWTGYYASGSREEPIIRVKRLMYRNNPILMGRSHKMALRAGMIWDHLEKAGVPDVKGVWFHPAGGNKMILIVSIKQRYPGHAKQAALIASQCRPGAYLGRYVIVVDEDIDPSNTNEVLWAVATRSDPEVSIDIIRRCWSGPLDPIFPADRKGHNSRAIIEACKPFEWIDKFPVSCQTGKELSDRVIAKWGKLLGI
ncbi:MAG: UbiD family decarboxylase [Desulfobacterales bacterium]|nr:UbiD family decarboxylase [Desulfobacterales bacterium]